MIGIEAIYPKRKKLTSGKDKQHKIYSYLLDKYWTNLILQLQIELIIKIEQDKKRKRVNWCYNKYGNRNK